LIKASQLLGKMASSLGLILLYNFYNPYNIYNVIRLVFIISGEENQATMENLPPKRHISPPPRLN